MEILNPSLYGMWYCALLGAEECGDDHVLAKPGRPWIFMRRQAWCATRSAIGLFKLRTALVGAIYSLGRVRFHSCSWRRRDWCFFTWVSISLKAFLQPASTFLPLP